VVVVRICVERGTVLFETTVPRNCVWPVVAVYNGVDITNNMRNSAQRLSRGGSRWWLYIGDSCVTAACECDPVVCVSLANCVEQWCASSLKGRRERRVLCARLYFVC
jgi:hypothetical protein